MSLFPALWSVFCLRKEASLFLREGASERRTERTNTTNERHRKYAQAEAKVRAALSQGELPGCNDQLTTTTPYATAQGSKPS